MNIKYILEQDLKETEDRISKYQTLLSDLQAKVNGGNILYFDKNKELFKLYFGALCLELDRKQRILQLLMENKTINEN